MNNSLFFRLDSSLHSLSVSVLGLGGITDDLEHGGLGTLGLLLGRLEVEPRVLEVVPGLGKKDVIYIRRRLATLSSAVDEDGFVDWEIMKSAPPLSRVDIDTSVDAKCSGLEEMSRRPESFAPNHRQWIPSCEVTDGAAFIASISDVIDAILRTRKSETDQLILVDRILKFPGERKTLEQLAASVAIPVTRERIRQKEASLIKVLVSAFLHGEKRRLGVSLHPSFTSFWKLAAGLFGSKDEVNFADFIDGLEKAWGVSADEFIPHLPLILMVLTSKATIPEALRLQMKLDPSVFNAVPECVGQLPLTSLPIGEDASDLEEYGLLTLGDLLNAVRSGSGPASHTRAGKNIRRAASSLSASILSDGSIDWCCYAKKMGLGIVPADDPASPVDFFEQLPRTVEEVVRVNETSKRAADIFRMRIATLRSARPTLEKTANALDTYGPSIKREESIMLAVLNEQLADGDVSSAKAIVQPNFLIYWREAARFYESSRGNFDSFRMQVSSRWRIPLHLCGVGAEILWAVLNEYPGGRSRSSPKEKVAAIATSANAATGLIKLRGFRTVH